MYYGCKSNSKKEPFFFTKFYNSENVIVRNRLGEKILSFNENNSGGDILTYFCSYFWILRLLNYSMTNKQ